MNDKWFEGPNGNMILSHDDFHISFMKSGVNPVADALSSMMGFDLVDETAICHDGNTYILVGDWREQLEDKSLKDCIAVFLENPDSHYEASDKPPVN